MCHAEGASTRISSEVLQVEILHLKEAEPQQRPALNVQLPVKPQDEIKVPLCSVQDVLIASDSPFPEELAGYVEKSVGGMERGKRFA